MLMNDQNLPTNIITSGLFWIEYIINYCNYILLHTNQHSFFLHIQNVVTIFTDVVM